MKSLIFPLLFLSLGCAAQQVQNQPLADSLAKWVVVDQTAAYVPTGKLKELSKTQWQQYKDSVFTTHERLLAAIFARYGYPGYDMVGEKGSNDFWLMVQHCDMDVPFQQKVLAAMYVQVQKHNADPKNFAYLTDRVAVNTGHKQIYGTQLMYNTDSCQAIPRPLADSLKVNEQRKAIGLEPIETYLNMMSQMHFEMNRAVYEEKGIHGPKLLPEPKP